MIISRLYIHFIEFLCYDVVAKGTAENAGQSHYQSMLVIVSPPLFFPNPPDRMIRGVGAFCGGKNGCVNWGISYMYYRGLFIAFCSEILYDEKVIIKQEVSYALN